MYFNVYGTATAALPLMAAAGGTSADRHEERCHELHLSRTHRVRLPDLTRLTTLLPLPSTSLDGVIMLCSAAHKHECPSATWKM